MAHEDDAKGALRVVGVDQKSGSLKKTRSEAPRSSGIDPGHHGLPPSPSAPRLGKICVSYAAARRRFAASAARPLIINTRLPGSGTGVGVNNAVVNVLYSVTVLLLPLA